MNKKFLTIVVVLSCIAIVMFMVNAVPETGVVADCVQTGYGCLV